MTSVTDLLLVLLSITVFPVYAETILSFLNFEIHRALQFFFIIFFFYTVVLKLCLFVFVAI